MIVWQVAGLGTMAAEPLGRIERLIRVLKSLPEDTQRFIEQMPAPMQLNWKEILFIAALVTFLYLFLKASFFTPMVALMDQREKDMNAGGEAKALAASMIEARQVEYQSKLRDLRTQAYGHRKALAEAASKEKHALLDQTRAQAQAHRIEALALLETQAGAAKTELMAQVDLLAESMMQRLLKQV